MRRNWTRASTAKIIIATATFFCFMGSLSFADEIEIPFAVHMDKFMEECSANGLDLYGRDSSQGFVENKGSRFIVYTYKMATDEQLSIIKDSAFKNLRG